MFTNNNGSNNVSFAALAASASNSDAALRGDEADYDDGFLLPASRVVARNATPDASVVTGPPLEPSSNDAFPPPPAPLYDDAAASIFEDAELPLMMAAVQDQIERELAESSRCVRRIWDALGSFHEAAAAVHAQWTPVQASQHAEAVRLDELQTEVNGSVGAVALCQAAKRS